MGENDAGRVEPDKEITDGAGRIVAGRFFTEHEAELVLQRLAGADLQAALQDRAELNGNDAHLWIWVQAEDLEAARTHMRPGDVTGEPRSGPAAVDPEAVPPQRGLLGRLRR